MAGTKGHSGGANRRPAYEHLRLGSFRADRHGSREAAQAELDRQRQRFTSGANALQPAPGVPEPPAGLVAGLGDRGRRLVLDLWAGYDEWSAAKLVILHELGGVADTLARYEAMVTADATSAPGGLVTHQGETVARLRAQGQRSFTLLLGKLDLKED